MIHFFVTELAEGSSTALDIKVWEQRHIKHVACKIKELLNKAKEKALHKKISLVTRVSRKAIFLCVFTCILYIHVCTSSILRN